MPQPYNLTNLTSSDNLYSLATSTNDLSGGVFALLIVFSIFIISYAAMAKWGFKPAFAASCFITAGMTILLRIMNWVSDSVMFISFLLVAAAYLLMKFD